MITSLLREAFTDRTLEPEELSLLARMLADWRLQSGGDFPPRLATQSLTMNLWGFPKAEGEALRARAAEAALSREPKLREISLSAPDVLTAQSPQTTIPRAPDALTRLPDRADDVRWLTNPIFDGLCAEIRLTTCDGAGCAGGDSTIVLWGVVGDGRFRVQATWATGTGHFKDEAFAHVSWPQENLLYAALYDYGNGKTDAPAWARRELYSTATTNGFMEGIIWFLRPLRDGVGPFLTRALISGGVAAASASLLFAFAPLSLAFFFPLLVLIFLGLCGFGYLIIRLVLMIQMALKGMREVTKKSYAQPVAFLETDLAFVPGALHDPALLKLSKDIEALGGRHFKDIQIEPEIAGGFYIRLYLFPEDATVFTLMLAHRIGVRRVFPAKPNFLLRTSLSDGWRLVSTSGDSGYRKRLNIPAIGRVSEGVTDPAIMLTKHRAGLRELAAGRTATPFALEEIVADIRRDHEEAWEALERYGYFHWDDAARMVFKIPRHENRA